jgi:hypothetical protein
MKSSFWAEMLVIGLAFGLPIQAKALDYHGRASLGSYVSHEQHQSELQGQEANDFATSSARLFYRANDFGIDDDLMLSVDLRDKHDFFNKLDRERQELSGHNTFQLRQASFRKDESERGLIWEAGRYAILNAGSAFNDGLTLGWRFSSALSSEVFGGLNPKRYDKSYVEYNPDATVYGALVSVVPKSRSWSTRKEFNLAYVSQQNFGEVDRQYLYQQSAYQWGVRSFLSSLIYLDFVPRTYVQNGQLLYHQGLSPALWLQTGLHAFDVIEYRRRQDLRERLTASPYREASFKATFAPRAKSQWSLFTRYGQRAVDDLERVHFIIENSRPRYFSKNIDFSVRLAQKKDFNKTGSFGGVSLGHFSDRSEYEIMLDAGIEKQADGTILHPILLELDYGFQISRRFFGVTGVQHQSDEKVKIYSAFFRVSYRFGNKEIPPIRDGAPPRGRL